MSTSCDRWSFHSPLNFFVFCFLCMSQGMFRFVDYTEGERWRKGRVVGDGKKK